LFRARQMLEARLVALEPRIHAGDEGAWDAYVSTLNALVGVLSQVASGSQGELLSTRQMAERLGIAPKTLLRRKAKGDVRPAMQAGKLIRWKGTETVR
jgi:hypothetical protein